MKTQVMHQTTLLMFVVIVLVCSIPGIGVAQTPITPVNQRTQQVQDAIVAAVDGVNSADDVTATHLAAITSLDLFSNLITVQDGDFDGLTALTNLRLGIKPSTDLSSDIFDDLTALTRIYLYSTGLIDLPSDIFDDLTALTRLALVIEPLTTLPSGIFDNLTALETLSLSNNDLTGLPSDIFDDLTALTRLDLGNNDFTALPSGIFDNLTALEMLLLNDNDLTALPSGVFDNLTALEMLFLHDNDLTALPSGIFDNLTALEMLFLNDNDLTALPSGIFDNLTALTLFWLLNNGISDVSEFEDLTSLTSLALNGNPISDYGPLRRLIAAVDAIEEHPGLTIDITIPSENNRPTFTEGDSTTRTIAENTAAGQNIGDPVAATDTDTGDTLTYFRLGTDGASFAIDSTTGQLKTYAALDYETKNEYAVRVLVYDGKATASIDVTINITDVDEVPPNNAPVFTEGTTTTRSVVENTATGQNIGDPVAATDADNDTLTYSLSGTDAASFDIVSTTGQLQTKTALNSETKDEYVVMVSVSDGTDTDTIDVTIHVIPEPSTWMPDANLRTAVRKSLKLSNDDILTQAKMADLSELKAAGRGISDITGVEHATNITIARFAGNQISNISALSELTSLTILRLQGNQITDITALSELTNLTELFLNGNQITDITPLAGLSNLDNLTLSGNPFSNTGANAQTLTTLDTAGVTLDVTVTNNAPSLTKKTDVSDQTLLLANYPNPSNPETWIPYRLAESADVSLTIYNVRGVMVRTLALGHQPAGFYYSRGRAAHWDGKNEFGESVASGVYFYVFRAGKYAATRRMLIRK